MNPTVAEFLESEWPPKFDEEYSGSCICCDIVGKNFKVWAHCWRSCCDECEFSGVHISGNISKEDKNRVAKHFIEKSGWKDSTDWNIVYDSRISSLYSSI